LKNTRAVNFVGAGVNAGSSTDEDKD
jgi:hypothetical protein